MSDFQQAIEWMKDGKKVTRLFWKKGVYLELFSDTIRFYGIDGFISDNSLGLDSIEATDWEIYDVDNWKLIHNINYKLIGGDYYNFKGISILKEKILADCDKELSISSRQKINTILNKRFGC